MKSLQCLTSLHAPTSTMAGVVQLRLNHQWWEGAGHSGERGCRCRLRLEDNTTKLAALKPAKPLHSMEAYTPLCFVKLIFTDCPGRMVGDGGARLAIGCHGGERETDTKVCTQYWSRRKLESELGWDRWQHRIYRLAHRLHQSGPICASDSLQLTWNCRLTVAGVITIAGIALPMWKEVHI